MTGKTPIDYKNSLKKEWPIDKLATSSRIRPVVLRSESLSNWAPGPLKRSAMFTNYLKIAFRNLTRQKGYSFINIGGLAAGMAIAMLIGLWINDELTYDRSFINHKQLAQVMTTTVGDNGAMSTNPLVPQPIAGELRSKYGSDFKNVAMSRWTMRRPGFFQGV
nr:ABC transporter permease [Spirosoma radiotolerans]